MVVQGTPISFTLLISVNIFPPCHHPGAPPVLRRMTLTWSADEMWQLAAAGSWELRLLWLPASLPSSSSGLRAHHELHPPPPPNQYCKDRGYDPGNLFLGFCHGLSAQAVLYCIITRKLLCQNSFTPEFCTPPQTGSVKTKQLIWTATTAARLATQPSGHFSNFKLSSYVCTLF